MCGICGVINLDGQPADPDIVARMNNTIAHRGPDDAGHYVHRNVGLGHRRLSIVDPARGHQPMKLNDPPLVITYNGEIYNHQQIREELSAPENSFRTTCDTETVLTAYAERGSSSVELFQGMFAFAIYDTRDGSLFLARDRLGIKPLYYVYRKGRFFAFASEIKALLAHPEVKAEVNEEKLPIQLSLKYTLDDETLFRGINKLSPGHTLHLVNGNCHIQQYWDVSFGPKDTNLSLEQATDVFREKFTNSVRSRLMADVPLGVFLSGGIDSSVIAASMARQIDRPLKCFSVAFSEQGYNELPHARLVAASLGADHHEIVVSPDQWLAAWPRMVYHEDEPIAHPSSIPLHFVSKLAASEVKVVLSGEGADELLAGYERYYQTLTNLRYGRFIPQSLRSLTRSLIDCLPDRFVPKQKAVRTSLYLPNNVESLFLDNYAAFPRRSLTDALQPRFAGNAIEAVYSQFLDMMEASNAEHLLDRLLYADIKTYLVELLMKQDQMSMSASIESRVPFLDHLLVEFVCRLPVEYKLKGFQTKRLLRLALGDTIPPQIVSRPKLGFPTPTRKWFRSNFHSVLQRLLTSDDSLCREYIRPEYVEGILREHRLGRWNFEEQIWTLANLEIWLRVFIDQQNPEAIFGEFQEVQACV
jgi:asparagine synthase (glutamine-hydrolysing)